MVPVLSAVFIGLIIGVIWDLLSHEFVAGQWLNQHVLYLVFGTIVVASAYGLWEAGVNAFETRFVGLSESQLVELAKHIDEHHDSYKNARNNIIQKPKFGDAIVALDKRGEARAGRLNLPHGRKTVLGFDKAAGQYLDKLDATSGKNMRIKRMHVETHLSPFFKSQPLDAIASFTLDRYKKHRREAGAKNGTINRELSTLSHILNNAVEWRWIKAKMSAVTRLAEEEGRRIALPAS